MPDRICICIDTVKYIYRIKYYGYMLFYDIILSIHLSLYSRDFSAHAYRRMGSDWICASAIHTRNRVEV